jgi:beta-lactamase regulating signal transducer with metallopeptidase domain/ankyrin repeat protein
MAADLLLLGFEIVVAVTGALLAVFLLRGPARAIFGARAAYCLWLLVPAMALAVLLPRAATPDAGANVAAAVVVSEGPVAAAGTLSAADTSVAFPFERPELLPNPLEFAWPLLLLWATGALSFAALLFHGQRRFLRTLGPLRAEQRPDGRVFHALGQDVGPALVGALVPRVVLPADFAERFSPEEQVVVVAHERVHQSGGDAQINLIVATARAVLWFHPLVHIAARLIRVDQELACDETVMARFPAARRLYAGAMLKAQLVGAPVPLGCHWLTGGKRELRNRITHLTRTPARHRRTLGAALAGLLALTGGAVAWAAQPAVERQSTPVSASTRNLIAAIQDGRNTDAAALIEAGANVNGWRLGDGSPLILAVRNGQLALARLLLDHGADPDLSVPGEGTPLIMAADNGDQAILALLLERGADPNQSVSGDGNPLIAAAGAGHARIVDLLLTSGARIDDVVPGDETALIAAARYGHLTVVRQLVEQGADVNLAVMAPRVRPLEPERRSPLGMARRAGRTDITDYLIAHGARA